LVFFIAISVNVRATVAGDLHAGLAANDITPVIGVPLAGFIRRRVSPYDIFNDYPYAALFKPSQGILDPIRSKALVLRNKGKMLLLVSADAMGVDSDIYDDIVQRLEPLGFNSKNTFISATHTHSGPGTLSRNLLWQIIALDRFQPKIYETFIAGIVQSVFRAYRALQPAELKAVMFDAKDLQTNRRQSPGHFDSRANILLVKSQKGAWLGEMVNFAIHGTSLGAKNLKFSADGPGAIERGMESRMAALNKRLGRHSAPVFLFIDGADGDVAPKHRGLSGIAKIGELFANQAEAAFASAPRVDLGNAKLNLKGCVEGRMGKLIPEWLKFGLPGIMEQEATISLIRLGDMAMMTWPGEPSTSLGRALKGSARIAGATQSRVLGLTKGYLAYFTTPAEYFKGGYEACVSFYGAEGGNKIVAGFQGLLNQGMR
jgi:hypothetical protein